MTPFDRVEPRIPELMSELAPAQVPDYFDTLLRQTARTRQRTAWSASERWLPMGVIARTAPVRQAPWRPILLLALVCLLAAAAVVALSGAAKPRLPAPFGLARNGLIVTSISGDIVTIDPATQMKTVIIAGPEADTSPTFSPLGTQILFTRTASDSVSLLIADADGSNVRQLLSGPRARQHLWWDWTADGRRLIYPDYELSGTRTWILDTVTGTTTEVHPGVEQHSAQWRPGHDEYIFRSSTMGSRGSYYLASADGPAVRSLGFPDGGLFGVELSPDGSTLLYVQGDGPPGPLHAIDIDTGLDRLLTQPGDGYEWSNPLFSPDGTQILVERYPERAAGTPVDTGYSLVLVPVDGAGPVVELSPPHFADGFPNDAQMQFSPDGKSVIANFGEDDTSWLLDTRGGPARRVDMSYPGGSPPEPAAPNAGGAPTASWQRLAP